MNQKDIEIIKILEEKFFFSKKESKKFLILIGENFKENLYKRLDKNKENFIKFLEKLIFWDNNRMIETSEKYFKNLKLDENKIYSKILDLGSAEGYFANFVKNNNFFCNDVFISIDTNKFYVEKGKKQGLNMININVLEFDFEEEYFDLIISNFSMPQLLYSGENDNFFLDKLEKLFINCLKILKKGGEIRFFSWGRNTNGVERIRKIGKIIEDYLDKKYSNNLKKIYIETDVLYILTK